MKKIIFVFIVVGLVFSFSGTSFARSDKKHKKKHGPPPHALAHGYRHKHFDGVDLEFNADRSIYIVIGYNDHYFHGNNFFRIIEGAWKKSNHISGPWLEAPSDILPPGLPPLPPPPPKSSLWNFFGNKD